VRHELDSARDRRGELAAAAAKLASDLEYLGESCRNELNLGREELISDLSVMRLEGELLAQEEAAHRELRARLEAMGPVNMMALEEYNEISQRHAFLEAQRKDLLESIENTQATIKELDEVSRQKFEEAFGKINENFQATFRKLFGGGQAFMRLTDLENSTESGIDVIASPCKSQACQKLFPCASANRRRPNLSAGFDRAELSHPHFRPQCQLFFMQKIL